MANHNMNGWAKLHGDDVAVLFFVTNGDDDHEAVDLLVRAESRAGAVRIAKGLGVHGVGLKRNDRPPNQGDLAALLSSGQRVLWRTFGEDTQWQPLASMPRIK